MIQLLKFLETHHRVLLRLLVRYIEIWFDYYAIHQILAGSQRRRRSSLAQLTDILREWSGNSTKRVAKAPLNRRETLADFARNLPWAKANTETTTQSQQFHITSAPRKRRDSCVETGNKNARSRREASHEFTKFFNRRESPGDKEHEQREEVQEVI